MNKALIFSFTLLTFASTGSGNHAGSHNALRRKAPLLCPVTKLPIASPDVAVGTSRYKGKTYYFCTSNCKRLFDKNPVKYAR